MEGRGQGYADPHRDSGALLSWNGSFTAACRSGRAASVFFRPRLWKRLTDSVTLIYRWAIREHIPFIRVTRFVPKVMINKLPAQYIKSLETQVNQLHDGEIVLSDMTSSLCYNPTTCVKAFIGWCYSMIIDSGSHCRH